MNTEKKAAIKSAKEETIELSDRQKALELALCHIEKQFGKGSIMKLGGDVKVNVETISTGALTLDVAL
ncbi:MAG: DNA recombination/repair protein RecA, partial [Candidatus Omnitrophota bacterium]|nr:DNA recombination/repair protein RecA [Candidatus Omnitrophota bacterium]